MRDRRDYAAIAAITPRSHRDRGDREKIYELVVRYTLDLSTTDNFQFKSRGGGAGESCIFKSDGAREFFRIRDAAATQPRFHRDANTSRTRTIMHSVIPNKVKNF